LDAIIRIFTLLKTSEKSLFNMRKLKNQGTLIIFSKKIDFHVTKNDGIIIYQKH